MQSLAVVPVMEVSAPRMSVCIVFGIMPWKNALLTAVTRAASARRERLPRPKREQGTPAGCTDGLIAGREGRVRTGCLADCKLIPLE